MATGSHDKQPRLRRDSVSPTGGRRAVIKESETGAVGTATVATPQPGPGEVLITLVLAGVCHSDLRMFAGQMGSALGYQPTYPLVLGHEFLGVVAALGDGVTNVAEGERVIASSQVTCGDCRWCRRGRSMLCEHRRTLGLDVDGVFAEHFVLPARGLVRVPDGISDEVAALAEPYGVAKGMADLAGVEPGGRVAVVGPGSIGQLVVSALRGSDITVFGLPSDERQLANCLRLGAHAVRSENQQVLDEAGTFDVVVEAAGSTAAFANALQLVAKGGRLVVGGVASGQVPITPAHFTLQELSMVGSRGLDASKWPSIPGELAERPELESVVSHVLDLGEFAEAQKLVESRSATKVLLRP